MEKIAVSAAGKHQYRLLWALVLTATFMLAEIVGSFVTGSLALLADAAHMLTDVGGLALALFTIRLAQRPATPQKTFGYLRAEILSTVVNAGVLLAVTAYILYEAYGRIFNPPEITSGPMLAIATVGLAVNLISMKLLAAGSTESLNMRGAYFEVLGDMLGSLGVIAAALILIFTGWRIVDPIIGAAIGIFIVPRTWRLLSEAVNILLEGTPAALEVRKIEEVLMEIPGVIGVHDLHVWTITSGFDAVSVHLVLDDLSKGKSVLRSTTRKLKQEFNLGHVTIQIEDQEFSEEKLFV